MDAKNVKREMELELYRLIQDIDDYSALKLAEANKRLKDKGIDEELFVSVNRTQTGIMNKIVNCVKYLFGR